MDDRGARAVDGVEDDRGVGGAPAVAQVAALGDQVTRIVAGRELDAVAGAAGGVEGLERRDAEPGFRDALDRLGVPAERIYVDYADLCVMSTWGPKSLADTVIGLERSA